MKRTMLKLLGLAAIAGAAFGVAHTAGTPTAHAADRRVSGGAACHDWNSTTFTQRQGYFRNPSAGNLAVYCNVTSDNTLRHDKVVKVNMHGFNGGAMSSRACVQYYNGSGGTCGNPIGWDPGNGFKSITGSYLAKWSAYPYHFPYLHTTVPAYSMIYGMWMHD